MGKRKQAKPKPPPPLPDELVDRVAVLLANVGSPAAVETACREKLEVEPGRVAELLTLAAARIQNAAAADKTTETGLAIVRLRDLYKRSITVQDAKTALAAQKELNKLLKLYHEAGDVDPEDNAAEVLDELAAVRGYLEPLGLGRPGDTVAELARLTVDELIRLRSTNAKS